MQYTINLKAGVWTRQGTMGRCLNLLDVGAAGVVDLRIEGGGNFATEELAGQKKGLKMVLPQPGFIAISLRAAVDTNVTLYTSDIDLTINNNDGASVTATLAGSNATIPVSNDRGAPGVPVYVSGITYSDAPATAINDTAPVNVTEALTPAIAANSARRGIRFTNNGAAPLAVGSGVLTWARRVIVLAPGDVWIEERAANLAWSAICAAGTTSTLNVQEVIA